MPIPYETEEVMRGPFVRCTPEILASEGVEGVRTHRTNLFYNPATPGVVVRQCNLEPVFIGSALGEIPDESERPRTLDRIHDVWDEHLALAETSGLPMVETRTLAAEPLAIPQQPRHNLYGISEIVRGRAVEDDAPGLATARPGEGTHSRHNGIKRLHTLYGHLHCHGRARAR